MCPALAVWLLGLAKVHRVNAGFDSMYKLLHILTPVERACKASAGTKITSSAPTLRADLAFCETAMPKARQCIAYSFSVGRGGWDLDKAMVAAGCRVRSFDPACCGGSHTVGPAHEFVPLMLAPSDGLELGRPATGNITAPGFTLKSLMAGFGDGKLDVLRLSVSSRFEWTALRGLIDTPGVLRVVPQLLLSLHFSEPTRYEEYVDVMQELKSLGFAPFYVAKQPGAEYLQIQEGTRQLYSSYEVGYGNVRM